MNILEFITYVPKSFQTSFQTCKSFVHLRNTIDDILDENPKACDCPIDCQVNCKVKGDILHAIFIRISSVKPVP